MNTVCLISVLGFAPALFWLAYFYHKDRLEPEPRRLVLRTHLWGIFCALPAALVEYLLPFNQWTMSVVGAPVVEESAKFLAVYLTIFRNPEFDEPMDGIVYGVAAALGFAALENVGYLFNAHATYGSAGLGGVFLVRGLLTVPAHALFAAMWGFSLGMAYMKQPAAVWPHVLPGILLGMGFHSLFNLLLFYHLVAGLGVLLLSLVMWRAASRRIFQALARSPHRKKPEVE